MELIIGTGLLCVATLFFCIILIGARSPKQIAWSGEYLIGAVYVPLLIIFAAAGTGLVVQFFLSATESAVTTGIGLTEDGVAIAMMVGTIVLIKALRIKKQLARFAAAQ